MDVHIRSLLCHHCVHTLVPQLQNLVLSWTWNDHLHCLVFDHCSSCSWPGNIKQTPLIFPNGFFIACQPLIWHLFYICCTDWGCGTLGSKKNGFVFHWRHQYTVHFRRPRRHRVSFYIIWFLLLRKTIMKSSFYFFIFLFALFPIA